MTRLYLLLTALISFLSIHAQDTSFYDRWKQIDQLIRLEGRNQTAVAEVERLYELAKQKQQSDQMIRALAYVSGLNRDLQEDSELLNIERLRKEIQTAPAPVKQLLYSLLAKQYVDYLNQNRWRLYNRTKTTVEKSDKVDTWSMATLHQQIQQAYLQSLEPASSLQKIRIDSWSQILSKGNSTNRRPTIFSRAKAICPKLPTPLKSMIPVYLHPRPHSPLPGSRPATPAPCCTGRYASTSPSWPFT